MLTNVNNCASASPKQRIDYVLERLYFDAFSEGILSPFATAVYNRLVAIDNGKHWAVWFSVSNRILMLSTCIGNENTLRVARQELVEKGFILYQSCGRGRPGQYQLVKLYDPVPKQFQSTYRQISLRAKKLTEEMRELDQELYASRIIVAKYSKSSKYGASVECAEGNESTIKSESAEATDAAEATKVQPESTTRSDSSSTAKCAPTTTYTSAPSSTSTSAPTTTTKFADVVPPNLADIKEYIDQSDASDLSDSQPIKSAPSEEKNNIRSSQVSVEPKNKAIGSNTAAAADQTRPDRNFSFAHGEASLGPATSAGSAIAAQSANANSPAAAKPTATKKPSTFLSKCYKDPGYLTQINNLYFQCFGHKPSNAEGLKLIKLVNTYGSDETMAALRAAGENNAYSLNYVAKTLKNLHALVGGSECVRGTVLLSHDDYNDDSYYHEDDGLYPGLDPYSTAGIPRELLSIMDQEISSVKTSEKSSEKNSEKSNEKKNKPAKKRSDAK